jgi:hypothetical protein
MNSSNSGGNYDRTPREWEFAKDFSDEESGICVRVNSCTFPTNFPGGIPMKQFSYEVVRMNLQRVTRFFPVMMDVTNGKVKVKTSDSDTSILIDLIYKAREWCREQRQEREDQVMEVRLRNENKKASYGHTEDRPGLKRLGRLYPRGGGDDQ